MPKSTKKDALVLYVIDRSGSMGGLEKATADGFNDFVSEQAGVPGNCYMSVCLFDHEVAVPFVAASAAEVPRMEPFTSEQVNKGQHLDSKNPYFVRGSTALRDAVGTAILGGEAWLANNPWFKGKVVVSVITDGGENASRQWSGTALKQLIERKQGQGWVFTFDGANESWLQAGDLAFNANQTFAYAATSAGTAGSFTANSAGVSTLRSTGVYSRT